MVESSYTPAIHVIGATPLFNIKEWLKPHLAGQFKNHSKPLWFRLRKKDGITRMHYKMFLSDSWLPKEVLEADEVTVDEDSKGLICLKVSMIS